MRPHRWTRAVIACIAFAASSAAFGQSFPAKTVRIIVPYPPGGTTDVLGRIAAERLTERWNQQVIVENRPGATGNIGADLVAKSAPDGYTLLVMPLDIAINPALYKNLPYDVRKDLAPISALAFSGLVITAHPSTGIKTLQELISRAKAEPGKLNYASCGNGTPHHLAGELLKSRAGIELVHVPYKGCGLAQTAALAGEVPISINSVGNVAPLIKADRLKGVAATTLQRDRELPDVPTVAESGYGGFDVTVWFGMFAPAATPQEVIGKIYADLKVIFADPALQKRLHDRSLEVILDSPEHFKKTLSEDVERYGVLVRKLGLQLD
jgi:tripartite-type tricarboxylate transporter receptor subunit TctC